MNRTALIETEFLSVASIARRLGIAKSTALALVHRGAFPGTVRVGPRLFRVPVRAVENFLNQQSKIGA
jgi:excisionase family DNA binding protein